MLVGFGAGRAPNPLKRNEGALTSDVTCDVEHEVSGMVTGV